MESVFLQHEYARCMPPEAPGVCDVFLRQLTIIYHFIHYRLDRPGLPDEEWSLILKELHKDLRESLAVDAVPADWKSALLMGEPRSAEDSEFQERYASSLRPLFAESREKIEATLAKLGEIESASEEFSRPSEKNDYLRRELGRIREWAFKKSWEVFTLPEGVSSVNLWL